MSVVNTIVLTIAKPVRTLVVSTTSPAKIATIEVHGGVPSWTAVTGKPPFVEERSLVLDGDFRSWYQASQYKKLLDMSKSNAYPWGILISGWELEASVADPATELSAELWHCEAPAGGAFPGADPVRIDDITSVEGNSSCIIPANFDLTLGADGWVPAGKVIYLKMLSDPLDALVQWTLTIRYTIPTTNPNPPT